MVNKRLVWYLEKEGRIDERQFGFRKQRSTIDAISKITTKIINGFRDKQGTSAIFFDIEKAYDKINREKTLEQLEIMGIKGRMLKFIKELISERWIKVNWLYSRPEILYIRIHISGQSNRQTWRVLSVILPSGT